MYFKSFNKQLALAVLIIAQACSGGYTVDKSGEYPTPDFSMAKNGVFFDCSISLWEGSSIVWGAADKIGLICSDPQANNLALGVTAGTVGQEEGRFYTGLQYVQGQQSDFVVYYPYTDKVANGILGGELPSAQVQSGLSTSHLKNAALMSASVSAAQSDEAIKIGLENIFSYLKIKVASGTWLDWQIKSIKLSSATQVLAGKYSYNLVSEELRVAADASNFVVLNANSSPSLAQDYEGYLSIFPNVSGELGIEVVIAKDDEDFDYAFTSSCNIAQSAKLNEISINLDELTGQEVGNLSINLSQDAHANCYVCSLPGATYCFDATVMGNGYTTPEFLYGEDNYCCAPGITPQVLAPASAGLLWQTAPGLISSVKLKRDKVYFSVAGTEGQALTEGNAVIAIYSGPDCTGDILWSWHIWVTAVDLEAKAIQYTLHSSYQSYSEYASPVVMDRNLGALDYRSFVEVQTNDSFGLKYQWGRKDPFLSSNNSAFSSVAAIPTFDAAGEIIANGMTSSSNFNSFTEPAQWQNVKLANPEEATIENSIKYPMSFICRESSTTNNWLYNANGKSRNDLWGVPNYAAAADDFGHKSIYDPCPAGWRVPHGYYASGFTSTGKNSDDKSNWNATNTNTAAQYGLYLYVGATNGGATTYYPCAGMIDYITGTISRAGTYCYYWTASANSKTSHNAIRFHVDANHINVIAGAARAYGHSIRCIKE